MRVQLRAGRFRFRDVLQKGSGHLTRTAAGPPATRAGWPNLLPERTKWVRPASGSPAGGRHSWQSRSASVRRRVSPCNADRQVAERPGAPLRAR